MSLPSSNRRKSWWRSRMNFRSNILTSAPRAVLLGGLLGLGLTAIGSGATGLRPASTHAAVATVKVFYAGSLTNLNETLVGPAFGAQSGYSYQGTSEGSLAIVNQIKSRIANPDVIELADPSTNALLMGSANGDLVSWYLTFARTRLVVGFDPRSKFAPEFRAVQHHKMAWYRPLEQKGLRIGRTDPNLDPKGYRALFMASLAQKVYHLKNFSRRIFGPAEN